MRLDMLNVLHLHSLYLVKVGHNQLSRTSGGPDAGPVYEREEEEGPNWLQGLQALPCLQDLVVKGFCHVDVVPCCLTAQSPLLSLCLIDCVVTDFAFRSLAKCADLQQLIVIMSESAGTDQFTDTGVRAVLQSCTRLNILKILFRDFSHQKCKLTNKAFQQPRCTALSRLHLEGLTHVGDGMLDQMSACIHGVQELWVGNTAITIEGLVRAASKWPLRKLLCDRLQAGKLVFKEPELCILALALPVIEVVRIPVQACTQEQLAAMKQAFMQCLPLRHQQTPEINLCLERVYQHVSMCISPSAHNDTPHLWWFKGEPREMHPWNRDGCEVIELGC